MPGRWQWQGGQQLLWDGADIASNVDCSLACACCWRRLQGYAAPPIMLVVGGCFAALFFAYAKSSALA